MATKQISDLTAATSLAEADLLLMQPSGGGNAKKITKANALTGVPRKSSMTSYMPAIAFGGGATGVTYTAQTGGYQQIGQVVYFWARIVLSSKGSSTGNATISVPVTPSSGYYPIVAYAASIGPTVLQGMVLGTAVSLYKHALTASASQLTDSDVNNTSTIIVSGCYIASAEQT